MTRPWIEIRPELAGAPDPDDAVRALDRLVASGLPVDTVAGADEDLWPVLYTAVALAPYLATLGARDPGRILAAARDPFLRREKPRDVMRAELSAAAAGVTDAHDLARVLRAWRAREYIRLGARELGLGAREEVGRELSALADVALDTALAFHEAELDRIHGEPTYTDAGGVVRRARMVVIGMGKLGGEELNFSSDIDLIYLYSSDNGAAGTLSLHEYFSKLARRLTSALSDPTEDDAVFRIDLRLRPEGSRGPMVNSLHGAEAYYESFGRAWERQAWIKARSSAGDLALGDEAQQILEPFVFPRSLSEHVVRDVEELNRKIKSELVGRGEAGFDVKLGDGGIREIEFFVQALQLVHAGRNKTLRERSTRGALNRLMFAGLVADREARALRVAYDFLRHVEHVIQLEAGRQTHRVPEDPARQEVLARRLGLSGRDNFTRRLGQHTRRVAALFGTLGTEPEAPSEIQVLFDFDADPERVREVLGHLGFEDPPMAASLLALLRNKPSSPFGPAAGEVPARAARALIREIAASPDPEQALRFTLELVGSRGSWTALWKILADEPAVVRLLASLFGTSEFLAKTVVARPDLLDAMVLGGQKPAPRSRRQSRTELAARLAGVELVSGGGPRRGSAPVGGEAADRPSRYDDEEGVWNVLNRWKAEELLRIGLADVGGVMTETRVSRELTDLADAILRVAYRLVRHHVGKRHGPLAPMAVVALGKHGGRELGYASDLDLIFVYEGGFEEAHAMAKLAQRLVNGLGTRMDEGRLYTVDTRLRPSGEKGTLVSSLDAWRRYHAESARLWEKQALIKARPVAGGRRMRALVAAEIEAQAYADTHESPADVGRAIVAMRRRMERERAEMGDGDIKLGRGGLVDIEFAAQYLQLVHGPRLRQLRVRSTPIALRRAQAAGVLEAPLARTLLDGYRFLRRLEHRMRIVHDRPVQALPRDHAELDKLARRVGYGSANDLHRAFVHWTHLVRDAYLQVFRDVPDEEVSVDPPGGAG